MRRYSFRFAPKFAWISGWLWVVLLSACQSAPPPTPAGPTVGALPILAGATELSGELPRALAAVIQVHKETVDDALISTFQSPQPLVPTIDLYDTELVRLDWTLVDVLEFGDGGFVRRYHRGEQRAILAFHPTDSGTDFALIQGQVR